MVFLKINDYQLALACYARTSLLSFSTSRWELHSHHCNGDIPSPCQHDKKKRSVQFVGIDAVHFINTQHLCFHLEIFTHQKIRNMDGFDALIITTGVIICQKNIFGVIVVQLQ